MVAQYVNELLVFLSGFEPESPDRKSDEIDLATPKEHILFSNFRHKKNLNNFKCPGFRFMIEYIVDYYTISSSPRHKHSCSGDNDSRDSGNNGRECNDMLDKVFISIFLKS